MLASLVRRVRPVQASVCAVRNNIQTTQTSKKHTLPDLPYDYNALEPVISAEIMQLHHGKSIQLDSHKGGVTHDIF